MSKSREREYWQQYVDEFRKLLAEARQVLSAREFDQTLGVIMNVAVDERIGNGVRLHEELKAAAAAN